MIFHSTTVVNVDAKGRIAIPTRYREGLLELCDGRLVVAAHGLDQCLKLYPINVWESVALKFQELPGTTKTLRNIKRRVLHQAEEVQMDGSSRILLPAHLREFALIDKKIMFSGSGDCFELCAESVWNANDDLSGSIEMDELPDVAHHLPY